MTYALDTILGARVPEVTRIVQQIVSAVAERRRSDVTHYEAQAALLIGRSRYLAALLGAERTAVDVRRTRYSVGERIVFAGESLRWPTFAEAIDALLERQPLLGANESLLRPLLTNRVMSFARRITASAERRVRKQIASSIRDGLSYQQAVREIVADTSWSRAYAETVYRTNATAAYAIGQRRIAAAPELAGVVAGFMFDATMDRDTRANHAAADGFVARAMDPAWSRLTPPLGFNCRCSISPVTRQEAERHFGSGGVPISMPIPPGAGPDPGFTSGGGA